MLFGRGGENRIAGVLNDRSKRPVKVEHDEPARSPFQRRPNAWPFIKEVLHRRGSGGIEQMPEDQEPLTLRV